MNEIEIDYKTDFLFSKSNFWRGIGSVFNIPGNFYEFNSSKSSQDADKKALTSDWKNVGYDIETSQQRFEKTGLPTRL